MNIKIDDLTGPEILALLQEHLRSMALHSPPESVHALDVEALRQSEVTFWTAWERGELLGCGALKELDARHAEIKSMRTSSSHLRKGVARSLLEHLIQEARRRGYSRLSLETGSTEPFKPARELYAAFGFTFCEPFADYVEDPYSVFMTKELISSLMVEVARFRAWADASPSTGTYGEWECDYASWPALHAAVLEFVASRPFASWSEAETVAVLYSIARDNEIQYLAREIRERHPALIVPLARAALRIGERDDRWQLAVELGHLGAEAEIEQLLLVLVRDEHEYVRRQALRSLLRLGSSAVEELALAAWHHPDEDQEHARMMSLHCLREIGSPHLEPLLAEAERDTQPHLRGYAERIRRGDLTD